MIPRNGRPRRALFAPAVLALALAGGADKPPSPEDEARSIRLAPGLRLELVAAEPMVVSPVAMAFDERGRLFVAENRGYPSGPGPGKPPAGRIALLEDLDGDGRMDRRNEFAEGLTFPNGVLPWRGGLIAPAPRTSSTCSTATATAGPTSAGSSSPGSRRPGAHSSGSATRAWGSTATSTSLAA